MHTLLRSHLQQAENTLVSELPLRIALPSSTRTVVLSPSSGFYANEIATINSVLPFHYWYFEAPHSDSESVVPSFSSHCLSPP